MWDDINNETRLRRLNMACASDQEIVRMFTAIGRGSLIPAIGVAIGLWYASGHQPSWISILPGILFGGFLFTAFLQDVKSGFVRLRRVANQSAALRTIKLAGTLSCAIGLTLVALYSRRLGWTILDAIICAALTANVLMFCWSLSTSRRSV
jgi:hypothetical protein